MIYSAFDLVVSKGQRTEPCQNPNLSVAEHWNQTYLIWAATAFVAQLPAAAHGYKLYT